MPKAGKKSGRREPTQTLKGWKAIGAYLGIWRSDGAALGKKRDASQA